MSPELMMYAGPGALTALVGVIAWLAKRLWARLDKQDSELADIKATLATELRAMDVRISVIEAHLGLDNAFKRSPVRV